MQIRFEMKGIREVINKLGADAADDLQRALELDIQQETSKMAVQAAKDAPVETGALKASILSSPRRAGTMTFYWGSRLPYALRQEFEHKAKRGWMRRSWRLGKRETARTIKLTIKRRLG